MPESSTTKSSVNCVVNKGLIYSLFNVLDFLNVGYIIINASTFCICGVLFVRLLYLGLTYKPRKDVFYFIVLKWLPSDDKCWPLKIKEM